MGVKSELIHLSIHITSCMITIYIIGIPTGRSHFSFIFKERLTDEIRNNGLGEVNAAL